MTLSQTPLPHRAAHAAALFDEALKDAPAVDLSWIGRPLGDNGWELAPDVLRLLAALVARVKPRHIVEFGSGVSTLVFAYAAARSGDCLVSSIDHDPKFSTASMDALATAEGAELVSLQFAPLVARVRGGGLYPSYLVDPSKLASASPADVILIDGPPGVLGGRMGMLDQALEYAQSGSIVLLDDASRDDEQKAIGAWNAQVGDAVQIHRPSGFARGLAAMILVAPTTARIRMASARGPAG